MPLVSCEPLIPAPHKRLTLGWGGGEGSRVGSPRNSQKPLIYSLLSPSYATDDDIVFEDFARLRLKGMKDDDCDDQFC